MAHLNRPSKPVFRFNADARREAVRQGKIPALPCEIEADFDAALKENAVFEAPALKRSEKDMIRKVFGLPKLPNVKLTPTQAARIAFHNGLSDFDPDAKQKK